MYDTLVAKVDNIDTSGLVKKTDYNTKITEIKDKIPDSNSLATKTAFTTVENKIPSITGLVRKTNYKTKIIDIKNKLNNHNHDKYVATSEFNTLAANVFNAKLAQANLITKTDFDAKLSNLNRKITANKTKHFLNDNDLSYYRGKQYFDEGSCKQNYLVFLPMRKYFKLNSIVNTVDHVLSWQSKRLSNESIRPPTASDNSLNPELNFYGTKTRVKFTKSCLKQSSHILTHKHIANIYIVYELAASSSYDSDPTIKNCLFGAVTLTKNTDIEKYKHLGYGVCFDRRSSFLFTGGGSGQNVLIFGADMSTSIHIGNKKDILVLGRGLAQGLGSTLTAEKMYSINFTVTKKKFSLSLHYNRANSYLFLNGTEIITFKAKISAIVASPLCLGNISKDWMKKTGLTGYVYDFSADYNAITIDNIKDIHNYLMKKNDIV